MTTIVLCLISACAAAIISWLFLKNNLTRAFVPASLHQELDRRHQLLTTEEGVLQALYNETCKKREEAEKQVAAQSVEILKCSSNLATAIAEKASLGATLGTANSQLQINDGLLAEARTSILTAEKTISKLQSDNDAKAQLLAGQTAFVEGIKVEMETQFRLIANASLDDNSRRMTEQQKEKLETTLQPFREQIDAFRKQVDEKFTAEVADRNTLKGELSKVFALANTLTDQTNKLSNALTSNTKAQGNYGEDILLIILRNAGMIEGEHFRKQFNTKNEDGQRVIPDIVLGCPDGYSLVIDSKVSLSHYIRYCNEALTPEEEKALRKEIWQSFKSHIDGLSGKKYESIEHCADFVLMFAPVESAFTVAAQHDSDIRNYAFQKKVFLVTPSNLLMVVKMIGDLWQKDRVNKEAREMANRAKALYEKACSFLTSFTEIGASLEKAQAQYEKATGQLTGNGGLVRQGELLQTLMGRDSQKILPAALIARLASDEAGDIVPSLS